MNATAWTFAEERNIGRFRRNSEIRAITITTLVENYGEMLIPNTNRVKRPGLAFRFDPRS
jgi:hypothetical protein